MTITLAASAAVALSALARACLEFINIRRSLNYKRKNVRDCKTLGNLKRASDEPINYCKERRSSRAISLGGRRLAQRVKRSIGYKAAIHETLERLLSPIDVPMI